MVSRDRAATAVALPQRQEEEEEEAGGGCGGNGGGSIAVQGGAGGEGSLAESSYSIMNNTFRVDSRYSGLKAIGKGSFGFVCSALDEKQVTRVRRHSVQWRGSIPHAVRYHGCYCYCCCGCRHHIKKNVPISPRLLQQYRYVLFSLLNSSKQGKPSNFRGHRLSCCCCLSLLHQPFRSLFSTFQHRTHAVTGQLQQYVLPFRK